MKSECLLWVSVNLGAINKSYSGKKETYIPGEKNRESERELGQLLSFSSEKTSSEGNFCDKFDYRKLKVLLLLNKTILTDQWWIKKNIHRVSNSRKIADYKQQQPAKCWRRQNTENLWVKNIFYCHRVFLKI